jgi:hypothetical protein
MRRSCRDARFAPPNYYTMCGGYFFKNSPLKLRTMIKYRFLASSITVVEG